MPTALRSSLSPLLRMVPVVLGLVGLLLGLGLAAFEGKFLTMHYVVWGVSLAMLIGGILWTQETRWRDSAASFVYTFFFIACVGLVYLISANRYGRFDLTANRVHTLDPQTLNILGRLQQGERIQIQLFAPWREHQELERFLESYRRHAPGLAYELYDPARDLDAVMAIGGRAEEGTMILARVDAQGEVIRRETDRLKAGDRNRESILTNVLARMLAMDQRVIYFTTGHGERPLDESNAALTKVGQLVADASLPIVQLRLLSGPIPANTAAIVIAGPSIDLFDPEREMLEEYLDQGGKLFLLLDPMMSAQADMPNFEALLRHIGLESPNELIVDPQAMNASGSSFTPQVQLVNHPIRDAVGEKPFFLYHSRAFVPAEKVPQSATQSVLLMTNDSVWTESRGDLRSTRRPVPPTDPALIGARYPCVTVERPVQNGRFGRAMRVVAIGDSDAFVNAMVMQNGGAAAFFLGALSWLREEQGLVYIPPKVLKNTPVTLTGPQALLLAGLFLVIGLAITVGGTVWSLTRRRLK